MGVFSVVGGNLVLTDGTLDFENPTDANTDGVYEITVNVFDGNDNYQENFTVSVNDLNDAPTDIALSANTVDEQTDTSGGHIVGALSGTDEDVPADTLTFTVVGGADMGVFSVVGGNLVLTDGTLDFENPTDANTDGVYEITVNVFDGNDNYQENFTVSVNDLNDAPTDIALSANTVDEQTDTVAATLSAL